MGVLIFFAAELKKKKKKPFSHRRSKKRVFPLTPNGRKRTFSTPVRKIFLTSKKIFLTGKKNFSYFSP
jgi:hypothetical protein